MVDIKNLVKEQTVKGFTVLEALERLIMWGEITQEQAMEFMEICQGEASS